MIVFARGLKTKIALNIAVLLLAAMLLIDVVAIMTTKRDLIRGIASNGLSFLKSIEKRSISGLLADDLGEQLNALSEIQRQLSEAGIDQALIVDRGDRPILWGNYQDPLKDKLLRLTRTAIKAGEHNIALIDPAWGILGLEKRRVVVSLPLMQNESVIGAASVVLPLDSVYRTLRNSQKLTIIYILLNTVALSLIGIYRISKAIFQPLARLAKRAEEYKEDDGLTFAVRKEDNELSRLSKALNGMLRRISADKETLRSTVDSLENTNLELKKAQREVIQAEKLASAGRLSAGVAHEIGNPIGIVMGYLELLKQSDISQEERDEYIHRVAGEIERINTIIRQLLEISRPSHLGLCPVSVHALIDDVADVIKMQPLICNIDLSLDLRAEDDRVYADPNQLRQVFLNLIINAADAIASSKDGTGGSLEIGTENTSAGTDVDMRIPADLCIRFKDNGPGIPEENLGNIFDPFYTTKEPGKGTGLGLSVSFSIIENFGGKMTAGSVVGEGTTLVIQLPLLSTSSEKLPMVKEG